MITGTTEDLIARIRAYLAYAELSPRRLADLAGLSHWAVRNVAHPEKWNPTLDSLRKMESAIPPAFTVEQANDEYIDGLIRVRRWVNDSGLKRSRLQQYGIEYEWVRDIFEPTWAPSWFALRKMLRIAATTKVKEPADG